MRASHASACLVIVAITLITVFLFACGQTKTTISSTPSIKAPLTTSLANPVRAKNSTNIITNNSAITTTPDVKTYLPYVVNDSNKNKVVFNQPPQRIVAFDSAAVETIGTASLPIQVSTLTGKMCPTGDKTYKAVETGPDTGIFTAQVELTGYSKAVNSGTPTAETSCFRQSLIQYVVLK